MSVGRRRVAVTGLGAVTPFGVGVDALWQGLRHGRSAVTRLAMEEHDLPCRAGAQILGFDARQILGRIEARRLLPFSQYALAAAREAWHAAGLGARRPAGERTSVVVGNGSGGFPVAPEFTAGWCARGWKGVEPLTLPRVLPDAPAAAISIDLGARGPVLTCTAACTSGAQAIGQALAMIRAGAADVAIAGGTEAWVTPYGIANFSVLRALSTRPCAPEEASCPFDQRRDGFVPGEGAAVLILEDLEHARRRSALVLAEIVAFAANADAYNQLAPRPDGASAARCISLALEDAGVVPGDVDYVNAHGTSTQLNDLAETRALKLALGARAYRVPVSSVKSMIGHTLGASGAIESVATVMALRDGMIAPTLNLREPDPECDLDYVPEGPRKAEIRLAIKNSFAFGGQNACLVFRRFEPWCLSPPASRLQPSNLQLY